MEIKESDWKVFRRLRELALERYCQRVIEEVALLVETRDRGYHERYWQLWQILRERNKTIAIAFDDPRHSQALLQLSNIDAEDLLTEEELNQFSEEMRNRLNAIRELRNS